MQVTVWCNRIIRGSFYLLFILVPLILTPWNFELFEFNKMLITYSLSTIIICAWVIKMMQTGEVRIAKTPLDIPLALFVTSQLVSSLFSIDPHVSWFGYYSRFNGGMWSIFTYVALYYAFVTNMKEDIAMAGGTLKAKGKTIQIAVASLASKKIIKLASIILLTATVVALYGVAERLGIDKNLWVQDVQSRVFSTLGQPNWLAAYLVALLPLALALGLSVPLTKLKYAAWTIIALLFFVVLLFTRSRSGLLGLAVADIIFWLGLFFSAKEKKQIKIPFVIVHAAFILVVFFNGTYIEGVDKWVTWNGWKTRFSHTQAPTAAAVRPSGTLLESGGTESGTIRKYVWQGALNAWKSSTKTMIIGTGTETFAFAFYQYRPKEHNLTSEWDFLYNKAHNEYLNYLATTGLFGLGSYLLFIGTFTVWFIKSRLGKQEATEENSLLQIAVFAGWASILITNFFGFSVVIVQLLFFLLPAFAYILSPDATYRIVNLKKTSWLPTAATWVTVGLTVWTLISLVLYWQADTLFATGNRLARSGQYAQAQTIDAQAIMLRGNEPTYHDELASTLSQLTLAALDQKNATLAADLAKRSLAESDIALRAEPKNANFWKTRTKLFYSFSSFDPKFNDAAIESLQKAQALSPNDPKIAYNLAILYGRQANYTKALELLTLAKQLKPDYRDAYFGLYVFYTELKKPDDARSQLQEYLTKVDPNDAEFKQRLAK